MEMPIRIMITLFVAVVVGSTIIVFTKQMIDQSREDINKARPGMNPEQIEEQKIIKLVTLDNDQLMSLITECYTRNTGKAFERDLCFSVTADDGSWTWADVQNRAKFNVTKSDKLLDYDYALNIYFDPIGATERIELTR
jgi:hypothetical protein